MATSSHESHIAENVLNITCYDVHSALWNSAVLEDARLHHNNKGNDAKLLFNCLLDDEWWLVTVKS